MPWYVIFLRIVIAIAVGLFIGIEREYKNRPAGMRTHVLVALGACTVSIIECMFQANMAQDSNFTYNFGRLSAQVITGVGFLGAGTIIFAHKRISGLTTAASLWNCACLGIAVGYGYYQIAIMGGVLVFVVLRAMQKIVHVNNAKKVEIKFIHRVDTISFINDYFSAHEITVLDLDFNVEVRDDRNIYTNSYTLHLPNYFNYTDMVNDLSEYRNVLSIRTTHA